MIRLIAITFALTLATSAQATTPLAPLHGPADMITQVREACGPGRVRVQGVCVARTTLRQAAEQFADVRGGAMPSIASNITETLQIDSHRVA